MTTLGNHDRGGTPRIVHLCWTDSGGAGIAAYRLHQGLCNQGVDSHMLVLQKCHDDDTVRVLPSTYQGLTPCFEENQEASAEIINRCLRRWQALLVQYPQASAEAGLFSDGAPEIVLHQVRDIMEADLIHLHWISGFVYVPDLPRALAEKPIVWTLHDQNPFTGGCHYAEDCKKYEQTCGQCPHLGSSELKDFAWYMHGQKQRAFRHLPIHVVTPSIWLGTCSQQSRVFGHCPHSVIPNGLPTDRFRPYDRKQARQALNLPQDKLILLFGANNPQIHRKGLHLLLAALDTLEKKRDCRHMGLAIYGHLPEELPWPSTMSLHRLGHLDDEKALSLAYSAANAFVIPTLQDNLPNTIMEALSCACPVVGFRTGGVPDMVQHEVHGYLAAPGDVTGLIQGIRWLEDLGPQVEDVSRQCRQQAQSRFEQNQKAAAYAELYEDLLSPKQAATMSLQQAEVAKQAGDIETAQGHVQRAQAAYPYLAHTYVLQADLDTDHSPEALECHYRHALDVNPQCREALLALADLACAPETLQDDFGFYLDAHPQDQAVLEAYTQIQAKMVDDVFNAGQLQGQNESAAKACVTVIVLIAPNTTSDDIQHTLHDLDRQTIPIDTIMVDMQGRTPLPVVPSVRVFRPAQPIEMPLALNLGVHLSRTPYCTWIMGGGRLGSLAPWVTVLERDSTLSGVFGNDPTLEPTGAGTRISVPELIDQYPLNAWFVWCRCLHDSLGYFDMRYPRGADQDFWIRAALHGNVIRMSPGQGSIQQAMGFLRRKYRTRMR